MKKLSEQNFIADKGPLGPSLRPFWISFLLFMLSFLLFAGIVQLVQRNRVPTTFSKPFLEVTNREISLFVWQFTNYLRVNVPQKTAYMPGFRYVESQTVDPAQADRFVVAPPEVLFLYHTWKRLLSIYYIPRTISAREFMEFLESDPQWQPTNWSKAPVEYTQWIRSIAQLKSNEDLSQYSLEAFPMEVRQAFQGWKNYYQEGNLINEVNPTIQEMREFLNRYPHYARNYWVNIDAIEGVTVAGPQYLTVLDESSYLSSEFIPQDQLSAFLKVAFFNFQQANKW